MQEKPVQTELFADRCFRRIVRLIFEYRYVILGSMIMGLLAYLYAFTNKLPNHDDLRALFAKGTTFASGRWGLKLLSCVFPDVSMPWIYGFLCLCFITIGNCMIIRIFCIKSPLLQFLLGGLIVSFPSQTGTFGYMFTAAAYAVSLCASVAAAFFLCRNKKRYVPAVICMLFSLSVYQAYLSVTTGLLILFLIQQILVRQQSAKQVWKDGILFILFLLASLAVYWIATKIIWKITGTHMGTYANDAVSFGFSSLTEGIPNAYLYFYKILFHGYGALVPTAFSRCLHIICILLIVVELIAFAVESKDFKQIGTLLLLLAVFPLGVNCMYLFAAEIAIHTLVLYAFALLYVFFAILLEHGQYRKIVRRVFRQGYMVYLNCVAVCMAVILMCNVYTANRAFLNMHLAYENTYAFAVSVLAQLRSCEGYTADAKVAIVGTYDTPDFYYEEFSDIYGIMGISGISPDVYSFGDFFTYYMGTSLNFASQKEETQIAASQEFAQMPSFPDHGSIQKIDDVFVIKLSD